MPYKWKDDKKAYQKAYHKQWYQDNKEKVQERTRLSHIEKRIWWNEYRAGLKCEKCGEDHPATIDFHHRNPEDKKRGLADLISRCASKERILKEIDKCDVLCSNCHRKEHFLQKGLSTASKTG